MRHPASHHDTDRIIVCLHGVRQKHQPCSSDLAARWHFHGEHVLRGHQAVPREGKLYHAIVPAGSVLYTPAGYTIVEQTGASDTIGICLRGLAQTDRQAYAFFSLMTERSGSEPVPPVVAAALDFLKVDPYFLKVDPGASLLDEHGLSADSAGARSGQATPRESATEERLAGEGADNVEPDAGAAEAAVSAAGEQILSSSEPRDPAKDPEEEEKEQAQESHVEKSDQENEQESQELLRRHLSGEDAEALRLAAEKVADTIAGGGAATAVDEGLQAAGSDGSQSQAAAAAPAQAARPTTAPLRRVISRQMP